MNVCVLELADCVLLETVTDRRSVDATVNEHHLTLPLYDLNESACKNNYMFTYVQ